MNAVIAYDGNKGYFGGDRIEKLWMRDGAAFFFGPIFIHPEETEHEPTKMFYKREVFMSNLEETCPMTCVIGTIVGPLHMTHLPLPVHFNDTSHLGLFVLNYFARLVSASTVKVKVPPGIPDSLQDVLALY